MLPPVLKSIKDYLTDKGFAKRTRLEDALLEELDAMDAEVTTRIIEHKASDRELITSGPASSCACCGRAR